MPLFTDHITMQINFSTIFLIPFTISVTILIYNSWEISIQTIKYENCKYSQTFPFFGNKAILCIIKLLYSFGIVLKLTIHYKKGNIEIQSYKQDT